MIGVGTQGVVRFLTNAMVGRIGGPVVLGVVSSAVSLAQLLSLLWPTTTGSAASKFVARARGREDSAEISAVAAHLRMRAIQSGVLLSTAGGGAWAAFNHKDFSGATTVALLVAGYSGYNFTRGLHFGASQVLRATTWDVATAAVGLFGVLALLAIGVRGLEVLAPLSGAYCLYTLACWPWRATGKPSRALRREMDHFVLLGVVGTLASAGFLQASLLICRSVAGTAATGQYAAALTLGTPGSLIAASLSLALFPSMSAAWGRGDQESFRRQTDIAFRLLTLILVASFSAPMLLSSWVVHTVWGSRFDRAADILPILLGAVLCSGIGVAATNALTTRSTRGMVLSTVSSLTGMLAGGAVWVLAGPRFGIMGVAYGYLLGTALIMAIPVVLVWHSDQHRWADILIRLVIAAIVLSALVSLVRHRDLLMSSAVAVVFIGAWLFSGSRDIRMARAALWR